MDRRMLKVALVVGLGASLYWLLASFTLPYSAVLLPRVSGLPSFMVYAVMHLTNWAVVIAISVPLALVLASARLALPSPVLLGLLIATVGLAAPAAMQTVVSPWAGVEMRWSHAVDLAKFALTLPALTWLAKSWLPSNNSSKPTPLRGAA